MDQNTGDIKILNDIINRSLDKKAFLNKYERYLEDINEDQDVFEFKDAIEIESMCFWIWIIFTQNHVSRIILENSDTSLQNSYSNWSNHNVRKKREIHDEWLLKNLGAPSEKTPTSLIFRKEWGEVTSYTDMKSGEVRISIRYI